MADDSFSFEKLIELVNQMVLHGVLRESDKLIISTIVKSLKLKLDCELDLIFSSLESEHNPDVRTDQKFVLSEFSKYQRIRDYKNLNILKPSDNNKRILNLSLSLNISEIEKRTKKQSGNKLGIKEQLDSILNDIGSMAIHTKRLEHLFVSVFSSNFLYRNIRPHKNLNVGEINSSYTVKNDDSSKGLIRIRTNAMNNVNIFTTKEMMIVDLCYSKIQQELKERIKSGVMQTPVLNAFTLDLHNICTELNKRRPGTETREYIYRDFMNIFGTRFNVTSDGAKDFMRRSRFVDPSNTDKVFTEVEFNALSLVGNRESEDINDGVTPRYITVKIPDFMIIQIEEAIKDKREDVLDMYYRNKEILLLKHAGIVMALINYLSTLIVRAGFQHGPLPLTKFITNWYQHLSEKDDDISSTINYLFHAITERKRVLFIKDYNMNTRRDITFSVCYSIVDSFLVKVVCTNSEVGKLKNRRYYIGFIKMSHIELSIAEGLVFDLNHKKINLQSIDYESKKSLEFIEEVENKAGKYKNAS